MDGPAHGLGEGVQGGLGVGAHGEAGRGPVGHHVAAGCARGYPATLRVASCQDQGNTELREPLREVLAADAVCRRIRAEGYEVAEHHDGRRFRLRLPCHQGAEVLVATQMFLPLQSAGLRFVVVTPLTP